MGNSSQKSSFGYTVSNTGRDSVKREIMHCQPNHTVVLSKIYYNYKAIGSHRFIELYLSCQNCGYSKYVRMDKTSNASKNIDYFSSPFNEKGWWWWEYKPKRTYTYDDCINLFDNAPSGYHLTKNNCADFARYIWNRIY